MFTSLIIRRWVDKYISYFSYKNDKNCDSTVLVLIEEFTKEMLVSLDAQKL